MAEPEPSSAGNPQPGSPNASITQKLREVPEALDQATASGSFSGCVRCRWAGYSSLTAASTSATDFFASPNSSEVFSL